MHGFKAIHDPQNVLPDFRFVESALALESVVERPKPPLPSSHWLGGD